jgi:transcriptional regulator with XRE-family HTH domain
MTINSFGGLTGRPYPIDYERKTRVRVELARRNMSITDLANALKLDRGNVSKVISGRSISQTYETLIATFLQLDVKYLFPPRSPMELLGMAEVEGKRDERESAA